ncbi:Thiamine biosynthesis adenylyltransferase ThiF [Nocardioides sp. PD653]|nr:Thiamine biosynthesis adenylyltransferase ThiF [Nocardioides sp. PD653]
MTDALRQLMARPTPTPPASRRWDRLTHPIRCNNRIRIDTGVNACSVCGSVRRTR